MSTEFDVESVRHVVSAAIFAPGFRRATFAGAVRGATAPRWQRVVIRPILLRDEPHLHFSYFDAKKNITHNYRVSEGAEPLDEVLRVGFAGIHLATNTEEVDVRTTKKGKVLIGRRPSAPSGNGAAPHNRHKELPLPEGKANQLLEAMGILTRGGHVRPTMRPKYTQINELLKQLTHVLNDAGLRSLGRPVEILDCGCGLSYLTLAVHYYLNDVLRIPAHIIGVDVNDEVIRKSIERSERLGDRRPEFSCGSIDTVATRPDVVLALHACDTATDDALAAAVAAEAKLILSAPCCHHHLNEQLRADGPAVVMRPLLRHGILRQRTADIVTDSFRALTLRIMGYRTDVVEFVSPEHTARNLMIRAVRGLPSGDPAFAHEYRELKRFWGITPYIEKALGEAFQRLVHE
jgi:hypothetical protein